MNEKGMLDEWVGKNISLIIDLGDRGLGGLNPIKVEGNLVQASPEEVNSYTLLISDWEASLDFVVNEAMVKLDLGEGGVVEDITITVLAKEIF